MTTRIERNVAISAALARMLFCLYRAGQQSITIDEASTYIQFLNGPWAKIYGNYDANNHVLFSLLAKASVSCFGLSEFSLRLPTVIAGFFLTLGIFAVLRLSVRSGVMRWVAFAALCLHPTLLDFSIAARGYGLALALLIWAMFFTMRRRFLLSGVLSGLALSANLIMAFPVAGMWGAALLLDSVPLKERLRDLAVQVAPAETIFAAICFGALRTARMTNFYAGWPTISRSVAALIETSLHAASRDGLIGGERAKYVFGFGVAPLLVAFIAVAFVIGRFENRKDGLRWIPVLTLALSSAAWIAAHLALNLLYPLARTGLFLILLFGISWAIAADGIPRLRAANLALAGLLLIQFATQLHGDYFTNWRAGARIKDVSALLTRMGRHRAAESVHVSASWYHQPALEFYRQRWNIRQWAPVEWNDPTKFTGYDFYVLKDEDQQKARAAGIRIFWRDVRTGLSVGMNLPAAPRP